MDKKRKNCLLKLLVTMQIGKMKLMMGENQLSQSQAHVTAFLGTEG
jgi:hypothetical protein